MAQSASTWRTWSTRSGWRSCATDRFTASMPGAWGPRSSRQRMNWRQAVCSTNRPSAPISPVSSATLMNWPGATRPRAGWRQRTSASTPAQPGAVPAPSSASTGWYTTNSSSRTRASCRSASSVARCVTWVCMRGSNSTQRPRPLRLASYIAVSASRSRPSASATGWAEVTTPMLALLCRRWPRSSYGRASTCSSRSATVPASAGACRSASSTTNSSPPSRAAVAGWPRATVSGWRPPAPSRRAPCSRSAIWRSSSSPAAWPRVSFTCLKRSKSRNISAKWRAGSARQRATACCSAGSSAARLGRPVSASWVALACNCCSWCLRSLMSMCTPTRRWARPVASRSTTLP